MNLAVLAAGGEGEWEARWVAAFAAGPRGVRIVRRCVDVVDLLAAAGAGQGRVALIDASLRRLDADVVDRLLAAQVVPVGVVGRGDAAAEDRLRAYGIEVLVPADADPDVAASVVVEAARPRSAEAAPAAAPTTRAFGDPSISMAIPPTGTQEIAVDEPERHGAVIAVWGPTGAPGRTTVSIGLADELARLSAQTLLIDADVYGATIAATLGLLDESPGIAAACRAASTTRISPGALAPLCWQLYPNWRLLTGIPLPQRWIELRPAALGSVLQAARGLADFVVVDCGFCLETDEELSFDTVAPRRNGATLAVLDAADVVIVVGGADPIGMQRLVRGLSDLGEADVQTPTWVVLNRVRRGAVPGDPARELAGALERFAGRTPAALLPLDQDGLDFCVATGRTLAEARPASPLRRSLTTLAADLAGVPAPAAAGKARSRR